METTNTTERGTQTPYERRRAMVRRARGACVKCGRSRTYTPECPRCHPTTTAAK